MIYLLKMVIFQFARGFPSFRGAKQINEIPPSAILSSRQPSRPIDHWLVRYEVLGNECLLDDCHCHLDGCPDGHFARLWQRCIGRYRHHRVQQGGGRFVRWCLRQLQGSGRRLQWNHHFPRVLCAMLWLWPGREPSISHYDWWGQCRCVTGLFGDRVLGKQSYRTRLWQHCFVQCQRHCYCDDHRHDDRHRHRHDDHRYWLRGPRIAWATALWNYVQ